MCKQLRLNHKAFERAQQIRDQIKQNLKRFKVEILTSDDYDDPESIVKSLLAGFFRNVAYRISNGKYKLLSCAQFSEELPLEIHPASVLSNICPEFVLFTDVLWTEKHKYMMNVSKIEKAEWLFESGHYADRTNELIKKDYLAAID